VLINCLAAGINGQTILSLHPDAMKKTIRTNLLAPFHTLQVFLPGMLTSENGGAIVTVSSVLGQLTAAGLADYAASKAGLSALHRTLEAELRASGHDEKIKSLLVETGQMCTPLFDGIETPNGFFAPVLEPIQVAYEIVFAIDKGTGGVIRLPAFAGLANWYAVLPASIQRLARYLSGIDDAVAKAVAEKTPRAQSASSSRSESDAEDINAE
jgi:NAD(P)-dependent dehydrogenase (short-subunit alcohol dehydrogenase family)